MIFKNPIVFNVTIFSTLIFSVMVKASDFEWIMPKICVDGQNKPVSADPYPSCPQGSHLRLPQPGDPLPYRKLDQNQQQYKDMYRRVAPDGSEIIVASFDFIDPKNGDASRFKIWQDGYDAYMVRDGWVSGSETRVGTGEYGTTFFGSGCRNHSGLVFFPTSFLSSKETSGSAKPMIATGAWEEDNQKFPGDCPSHYGNDQIFTWSRIREFPFGGINGAPTKKLDTIVSTMGLRTVNDPKVVERWMSYGHLEVFYFTEIYGLVRWENWSPDLQFEKDGRETVAQSEQRAANASKNCSLGPNMKAISFTPKGSQSPATKYHMSYQGLGFTMNDCRDWSRITVQNPPIQPPVWPVSGLNLLRNFHFNGQTLQPMSDWDTGHMSHSEARVSTTKDDTTHDTPTPLRGISYVRMGCAKGCDSELIHQDIPVSAATPSGIYTLGVIARTEAGVGRLKVSVAQLDKNGANLSKVVFMAENLKPEEIGCNSAGEHCRQFNFDPNAKTGSVVLASQFVSGNQQITIDPGARKLRFEIAPASANDFDLVSAWLMRQQ